MRAIRGSGFAATALGLGVGAHVIGGGALPAPGILVFLAVPVLWVSFFLTRARRRWPTVIAALLAIETGLHEGLSLLSGPLNDASPAGGGPMVMGTHAGVFGDPAVAMPSADAMTGMPTGLGLTMVGAHLVATVLTGAALAYGEHLLWSLWTWMHHAVTVAVAMIPLPTPWTVPPGWLPTVSPVPAPVDGSVRRRGPPLLRVGLPTPG